MIDQIISGMSIDELVELRAKIDKLIFIKKAQKAYEKNLSDQAAEHRKLIGG
jgi:hypothetical protein